MIENIIDYISDHQEIFQYAPWVAVAAMIPINIYTVREAIKKQKRQAQGILSDKRVDDLTRLETKGIITIHKDKLKPYDLERLAEE